MIPEARLRAILEIVTAILLGLVSVATAAGAYQASVWAQQAAQYSSVAGQLRDLSLSSFIASDLAGFDDSERLFDAINLEFEIEDDPANAEELRAQQQAILGAATPGLAAEYDAWVASGYANDKLPGQSAEYAAASFAEIYGANRASVVAAELSDALGARSLQVTIASVLFALALLLLGVAGANESAKVMFALTLGGAVSFLVGIAVVLLAAIG
jgi:hypothetical protein